MAGDNPWNQRVRDQKQLTYFDGSSVGKWSGITKLAVNEFNNLAQGIVKYVPAKDKDGADVVIGVADGVAHFPFDGTDNPIVFSKTAAHGQTRTFGYSDGLAKAAVFMPSSITETHKNILIYVVAHELVHACGLVRHDNDGVFMTVPNIDHAKHTISAIKGSKAMPPFFFSASTISRLSAIW
jgi:hypothetical protein